MSPRLRSTSAVFVAFAAPFGIYVASLRSDVSFWDPGDLQTVAWIAGIPYPTGFPGYAIVGWAFAHLIPIGTVAWRVNLLSAFATALSAALVAALALALGAVEALALAAALVFAVAGTIWKHATYADVHPVGAAATLAAVLCTLTWLVRGEARALIGAFLATAVAVAIDTTAVLAVPGLLLIGAGRRPSPALVGRALVPACAIVLLAYAYLPLRSTQVTAQRRDPTLALGLAPGRPFWDDHHPASPSGFLDLVGGREFTPEVAFIRLAAPETLQRLAGETLPRIRAEIGDAVLWLGCLGALWWVRREPLALGGAVLLAALPAAFAAAYPAEADPDRYLIPLYALLAVAAASGAQALAASARRAHLPPVAATGAIAFAATLAQEASMNADLFRQPLDHGAAAFVARVAQRTPSNAVLVAPWTYATALAYGAYVSGALGSRIVVTADPETYEDDYPRWLRARAVVVISEDPLALRGLHVRSLDRESPHLYELR